MSLLLASEAADYLRISKSQLLRLARARRVPCVRLGERTVRFRSEDLAHFAELGGEAGWLSSRAAEKRAPHMRLSSG